MYKRKANCNVLWVVTDQTAGCLGVNERTVRRFAFRNVQRRRTCRQWACACLRMRVCPPHDVTHNALKKKKKKKKNTNNGIYNNRQVMRKK